MTHDGFVDVLASAATAASAAAAAAAAAVVPIQGNSLTHAVRQKIWHTHGAAQDHDNCLGFSVYEDSVRRPIQRPAILSLQHIARRDPCVLFCKPCLKFGMVLIYREVLHRRHGFKEVVTLSWFGCRSRGLTNHTNDITGKKRHG
jgi:hypothetical protein